MRAFRIPGALLLVMALAMGCAEEDEIGPTGVPSQPQTAKVLANSPPSWKIAFTSDRDTGVPFETEIYVMNADGSGQKRLTNNTGIVDFGPSWSHNGKLIAFGRSISIPTNSEIFVMNADGSGQTQLTFDAAVSFSGSQQPSWGR